MVLEDPGWPAVAVVQGTPWLIGLSLLTPGWVNIGQPTAASSGSVNSAGQYRLYVRVRHYTDFISTTVEVRASLRSPVQCAALRRSRGCRCRPLVLPCRLRAACPNHAASEPKWSRNRDHSRAGTLLSLLQSEGSGGGHTAKLGRLPGKLLPLRRSASAIPPSQRA